MYFFLHFRNKQIVVQLMLKFIRCQILKSDQQLQINPDIVFFFYQLHQWFCTYSFKKASYVLNITKSN